MAENGPQAISKAKSILPDVILLDVMMPGMTGFEVCERIRNDPQVAEIPIIILTALDDRDSLLTGLKAGADDFISKPFDRFELRARLIGITRLNRYQKLLRNAKNCRLPTRCFLMPTKQPLKAGRVLWTCGTEKQRVTAVVLPNYPSGLRKPWG